MDYYFLTQVALHRFFKLGHSHIKLNLNGLSRFLLKRFQQGYFLFCTQWRFGDYCILLRACTVSNNTILNFPALKPKDTLRTKERAKIANFIGYAKMIPTELPIEILETTSLVWFPKRMYRFLYTGQKDQYFDTRPLPNNDHCQDLSQLRSFQCFLEVSF